MRKFYEILKIFFVVFFQSDCNLSANKNSKKSVGIVKKIRPCGTEIPQRGCCDGCQVGKKKQKRKLKGGFQKRLQKGDKVAMIIKLATDKSWLASKNYKQRDPPFRFSLFFVLF